MIGSLSPRDRRVLALGAGAIALILLVGRGIPAWRRWDAATRASAGQQVDQAARTEAAVRELPAVLDSLQARRTRLAALGTGLLEGTSPAASAAALASLVSGAASSAGVQIGAVQVRPDTATQGTFLRVGVRADATGDLPSLLRMLAALEGGPERLAVRELSLTQPNPGGPPDQVESLRMEIAVEGLALAPGARIPAPATAVAKDSAAADSARMDSAAGGAP